MNKDEIKDLFQEQLSELDGFENEIKKIKNLINLIIENFDLLKDEITEEQIGEVSSDINVKMSKVIALVKDILSDSKKLESFIHEIKLLKRKRMKKLNQKETRKLTLEEAEELELIKQISKVIRENQKQEKQKIQIFPQQPKPNPYTSTPPNKWDIRMNTNKRTF